MVAFSLRRKAKKNKQRARNSQPRRWFYHVILRPLLYLLLNTKDKLSFTVSECFYTLTAITWLKCAHADNIYIFVVKKDYVCVRRRYFNIDTSNDFTSWLSISITKSNIFLQQPGFYRQIYQCQSSCSSPLHKLHRICYGTNFHRLPSLIGLKYLHQPSC